MAKQLKLNIKNAQIAEALKNLKGDSLSLKKEKKTTKKKSLKTKETEASADTTTKKRKARILPPIEKEKPKEPEEKGKAAAKKKASTVKKEVSKELSKEEKELEIKEAAKTEIIDGKKPAIEEVIEKKEAAEEEKLPKEVKDEKEIEEELSKKKGQKDLKPKVKKLELPKRFDSRDRMGLRSEEEEERWRKRKAHKRHKKVTKEEEIIRPKTLKIKLPITIKVLASEMKLKASELIGKLFLQGITFTLNDLLDDETTIQLLGHEFGCDIIIDTSEEERLRITDKSIQEEIKETPLEKLKSRPPIITFMGHVDHGKTSLIDVIRKSNIAAQEAGAITQHIGAFTAQTSLGEITILDTPGHEAFTEIRSRGAEVTDIVVLVVAGDEGMRDQTIEALNQAKKAKVTIVVAINKSDKAGYDPEKVYRQLTDHELLPEVWGGTTITVNTSATTKEGIDNLLEMLALQSEVLELKANPEARARGTILEAEMHKGLGATATVLVQNGTLRIGDSIVFSDQWGRIKTMHDYNNKSLLKALPSTPVKVTGLSGLVDAGNEFIVVSNEKEAKKLAEDRKEGIKKKNLLLSKKKSMESFLEEQKIQKILPIILRADVQGSIEALKTALLKIPSKKVKLDIINEEVGEISESDIELAAAANATIVGFHTHIETHAENLIKRLKVTVKLHDIIYHAIDDVKNLMLEQLDKIEQENDVGAAEVKTIFKSSHLGKIAGCHVIDGIIKRNNNIKVIRNDEIIFKGKIASLKRQKEDVKEVQKGQECGILIENFTEIVEGDKLQAFEITYLDQTL